MPDATRVSCFIHQRNGEIETIHSDRARSNPSSGVPTVAGLVPVTDIMTREVICARPDLPMERLLDLLVNNYIGCVPIVDEAGCPTGMVTKRDVVEPMANRTKTADEPPSWWMLAPSTAEEAMLPIAFTLDEHATVAQAAGLMAMEGLHHIPIVTARGRIVGVVSSLDIVVWLARNDGVIPQIRSGRPPE